MSEGRTRASHPVLTDSDGWLLAALTESPDQVSFGLQRLAAAGLLVVEQKAKEGLLLRATDKAIKLRHLMKAKRLGDDLDEIDAAIRAAAEPEPVEDRTLGRLPGLGAADLDAAIKEHGERVEQMSKPYVAIAQEAIRRQKRTRRPT